MRTKNSRENALYCPAILILIFRPVQITYFHILIEDRERIGLRKVHQSYPYQGQSFLLFYEIRGFMTVRICIIVLGYDVAQFVGSIDICSERKQNLTPITTIHNCN